MRDPKHDLCRIAQCPVVLPVTACSLHHSTSMTRLYGGFPTSSVIRTSDHQTSHQDGSPDIKYVAEPLGFGCGLWSWGTTTIFMILKISCQLGDRQTAWSGARNINWGTKCVVIMINWSRCWNWWVMTSVSSVLTTNQQLNLVPFLPCPLAQTGVIDVIDGIEKCQNWINFYWRWQIVDLWLTGLGSVGWQGRVRSGRAAQSLGARTFCSHGNTGNFLSWFVPVVWEGPPSYSWCRSCPVLARRRIQHTKTDQGGREVVSLE